MKKLLILLLTVTICLSLGVPTFAEDKHNLNNSEGLPFSFRVYATYAVPVALADKKLHQIIDQLNPDLRAVEVREGKTRKREFYAMEPEAAFNILRAMAELHGFEDRLKVWEETDDEKAEAENAKKNEKAAKKLSPFSFDKAGVPIGATITFDKDPSKTAQVVSNKRVLFEGTEYSLSALAKLLLGSSSPQQGPAYFSYEGVNLVELRRMMEEKADAAGGDDVDDDSEPVDDTAMSDDFVEEITPCDGE